MIRKLKIKFITAIMTILAIVFASVIGAINIASYRNADKQAMRFLTMVSDNDGMRPPAPKAPEPIPREARIPPKRDEGVFNLSNFYSVKLDENNNIIEVINDNKNLYTDEKIKEIARQALKIRKKYGSINKQRFLVTEKSYGKLIVFMDDRIAADNANQLLFISLSIGAASMLVLFIVSVFLANWLIKPVQEAFEKQKRFISDASHELKTPLSVIGTNADVLENEIGSNRWLTYIKSETARMSQLVTNLLTLAKLDDQDIKPAFSDFNLSKAIMSVVLPFESTAFEQKIHFTFDIPDNIFYKGDENGIKQVAVILTDNAFKHTEKNGEIRITLRQSANKRIFEVYNTGQGIDEAEKGKIFERFYRADQSRSRANGSYGLGLPIAKSIIGMHKGKITVESEKGKWVKFTVIL
ncbi:MAG: HAMP domain-containing histidine kinase [Clostridiaceae bacterium]|nr:HAMP domain-containing histidine kinase [Clostridiaceae bacterium]